MIVRVLSPDRIPSLVSNRIDVLISSTTPTPARALTVAFTQPYTNNIMMVVTRKDTGISQYTDLKSKKLGGVVGTTPEQLFKEESSPRDWNNSGATYTGYASDAESYLALQQGKIDAILIDIGVNSKRFRKAVSFPNSSRPGPRRCPISARSRFTATDQPIPQLGTALRIPAGGKRPLGPRSTRSITATVRCRR